MRIKSIYVNDFKSLRDFRCEFAPFTILTGPSGSGKTAVKDLVETLAGMLEYADLGLNNKKKAHNIAASIHHTPVMFFELTFTDKDKTYCWQGSYDRNKMNMDSEAVFMFTEYKVRQYKGLMRYQNGVLYTEGQKAMALNSSSRSILSYVDTREGYSGVDIDLASFHNYILNLKAANNFIKSIKDGTLSLFDAFLSFRKKEREKIIKEFAAFYPKQAALLFENFKDATNHKKSKSALMEALLNERMPSRMRNIFEQILLENMTQSGGVLWIDDADSNIDLGLYRCYIENLLAISENKQVIVSMREPEMMNSINLDTAEDGTRYMLQNGRGETEVYDFMKLPFIDDIKEKILVKDYYVPQLGDLFQETSLAREKFEDARYAATMTPAEKYRNSIWQKSDASETETAVQEEEPEKQPGFSR